ncbi:hypothetical protein [Youngiibacter multivorans]|uniref:PRD domain-containing protein n=1 Tax=Youngiibacter multivorans TaxID=937251 RepID=A0ABS4G824_9CLOT|nr:hypothetical protein [Youngiibacter multivorans]MBP1920708.1 hypothetical protein [Youngiibacter multivorans]
MDSIEINNLEQHVRDIRNYMLEVEVIERFLEDNLLELKEDHRLLFWNHFITLFKRIDQNEQNNLDKEETFTAEKEAEMLTAKLHDKLMEVRNFKTTEFEEFLVLVYMQMLIDERRKENE